MGVKAPPNLPLFKGAGLARSRTHEAFGAGARTFAAMVAGCAGALERDAVVWVRRVHDRRQLNPLGLAEFVDPARILLAECERPVDILWTMEEAMRLGSAGVVIAELSKPPDLKVSRRLQLAAEAGDAIGLCLVDDTPVGNAAETRWFCAPSPSVDDLDSTRWRLSRIKNKKGTLGAWEIEWDAEAGSIAVVSRIAGGPDGAVGGVFGSHGAVRRGRGGEKRASALFPE